MPNATDAQVQAFVDERIRVRAEQIRSLMLAMQDDKNAIDDVYAACAAQNPTWTDQRTSGPPHLLGPNDVLAYNAHITALLTAIAGDGNYAVVQKACVKSIIY